MDAVVAAFDVFTNQDHGRMKVTICPVSAIKCISNCIVQAVGALHGFDFLFVSLTTLKPAAWIVCFTGPTAWIYLLQFPTFVVGTLSSIKRDCIRPGSRTTRSLYILHTGHINWKLFNPSFPLSRWDYQLDID